MQYSKRIRFLTVLMLIVLVCTTGLSGVWYYDVFGRSVSSAEKEYDEALTEEQLALQKERDGQKKQKLEMSSVNSVMPDYGGEDPLVITDQSDAMEALMELQTDLGILDAENEFQYESTVSNEEADIYIFQQYYDGIEVYGHTMRLRTNQSGEVTFANGDYAEIADFDTDMDLSESDAQKSVEKYLKKTYQISSKDEGVELDCYGKIIYFDENEEPKVGYLFDVYEQEMNVLRVSVDGISGDVIGADNLVMYDEEMVTENLQGQQGNQTLEICKDSDTEYLMVDNDRSIGVVQVEEVATKKDEKGEKGYYVSEFSEIRWDISTGQPKPNESAVDALANLQRTYDYYKSVFGREGICDNQKVLAVFVDYYEKTFLIFNQFLDNACYSPAAENGDSIFIGKKSNSADVTMSAYLDVMGHEFTHGVIKRSSGLGDIVPSGIDRQKSIQNAINEGLADIFGELIEDWSDDKQHNNSCNWIIGENIRNVKNPSGKLLTKASDFVEDKTDCHDGSSIVSYPAYLMTQGIEGGNEKKIDTKTLGDLWYQALFDLHPYSDFQSMRRCVEYNARFRHSVNQLTDKQFECVLDAFDRVGIEPDYVQYKLEPGAKLEVYDINNEIYENYNIKISNMNGEVVNKDVHAKSYTLDKKIVPGIYHMLLTDLEDEDVTESFMIMVNDNDSKNPDELKRYRKQQAVYTEFGGIKRDVVLVLDVSGSMNGAPMQETKKSAIEFVDTILNANSATKISVIAYSNNSETYASSTNNRSFLHKTINSLGTGGNTNMYSGLESAEEIINQSKSDKRIIVLMSDGIPNAGNKNGSDDYASPLKELAGSIKGKGRGVLICTLGFFHKVDASELAKCRSLMSSLSSPGYHYEVSDVADVRHFFHDIAQQVSGRKYIYVEIACPVDVTVTKGGETLSSAEKNQNLRTEFGTISFDGEDNEVKILRLLADDMDDYEICINGTGKGRMDYSIGFADEEGNYSDIREFKKVPITRDTVIYTGTKEENTTRMDVDTDGDGRFDLHYTAGKNKRAEEERDHTLLLAGIGVGVLFILLLAVKILITIRRYKKGTICPNCRGKVKYKSNYCLSCGTPLETLPLVLPRKVLRKKQPKIIPILKLSVIVVCVILSAGIILLDRSAGNTVYTQLRNGNYESGIRLYEAGVEDSVIDRLYLSMAVSSYMKRVQEAYSEGGYDKESAEELYKTVENMKLEKVSEQAREYAEGL